MFLYKNTYLSISIYKQDPCHAADNLYEKAAALPTEPPRHQALCILLTLEMFLDESFSCSFALSCLHAVHFGPKSFFLWFL